MSKATGPRRNQLCISQYYSAGAVFVSVRLPQGLESNQRQLPPPWQQ